MDKRTGKTVWKTDRSVDFHDLEAGTGQPNREGDFRKAFSTPVIADVQGKPLLVSLGSMALYGYDPLTGEERWRVEAIGSHSGACRPVLGHGLVFSPMGSGLELWAVRPDGHGVVTDTHVAWKYKRGVPRRPSVLLVDDLLFMVDDGGVATCVEAKTGNEVWKEATGGRLLRLAHLLRRQGLFLRPGRQSDRYQSLARVPGDRREPPGGWVHGVPRRVRRRVVSSHEEHLYRIEDRSHRRRFTP